MKVGTLIEAKRTTEFSVRLCLNFNLDDDYF